MENTTYPTLDLDEQSLEIVKTFIPEFYDYLRVKPRAVNSLMALHRNGNDKAGEIITYLIGIGASKSPLAFTEGSRSKDMTHKNYPGTTRYRLTWSAFRIQDSNKNKMQIEFDFEVLFQEEAEMYHVRRHFLQAKEGSAFREDFLLKEVSEWLKEKGFKLRRANLVKNNGKLSPYVEIDLIPSNPKPHKEYPERDPEEWGSAKEIRGNCSIQILPIDTQ